MSKHDHKLTADFFWRGEIDPNFDLKNVWEGFESEDFCKHKRRELVALLKGGTERYRVIAKQVRCCEASARCCLPICPICGGRYRRWIVSRALSLLSVFSDACHLTYIPEPRIDGSTPTRHDLIEMNRWLKGRLRVALGVDFRAIGWIEVSYHARFDCLLPHIHIICATTKAKLNTARIHDLRDDRLIYRPWEVSKIAQENLIERTSYAFKQFQANRPQMPYVPKRKKPLKLSRPRIGELKYKRRRARLLASMTFRELTVVMGWKRQIFG